MKTVDILLDAADGVLPAVKFVVSVVELLRSGYPGLVIVCFPGDRQLVLLTLKQILSFCIL